MQKLEKFTQQPEVQGNLSKYSEQVQILKEFVFAIEVYVKINLDVEPIRKRVKKLNQELELKEQELENLKKNYLKNLQELQQLNIKYQVLEKNYLDTEGEYNLLEKRLERSESLVLGLSSSKDSWMQKIQRLQSQSGFLYGNSILSSVYLNYMGPFPSEMRQRILDQTLLRLKEK